MATVAPSGMSATACSGDPTILFMAGIIAPVEVAHRSFVLLPGARRRRTVAIDMLSLRALALLLALLLGGCFRISVSGRPDADAVTGSAITDDNGCRTCHAAGVEKQYR